MEELIAIPIIFMVIVAPVWLVLHYIAKFKENKSLSQADEETIAELWQLVDKLEKRVDVLETILEDEVPDWRSKS